MTLAGSIAALLVVVVVAVLARRARGQANAPTPPADAAPGERLYWLRGVDGPVKDRTFFLGTRVATIGRSPQNLVQVRAPGVSRVHCQVRADEAGLRIIDM